MTASEWVAHLRIVSRCHVAEITPAQAAELATVLEDLRQRARAAELATAGLVDGVPNGGLLDGPDGRGEA